MTIKSAMTVIALAAGLAAGPALAQAPMMIGTITVPENEAGAVHARCDELKNAADTESLVSTSDSDAEADETGETSTDGTAGNAAVTNEPEADGETAATVDLAAVTLEECEAGGWFDAM